MLRPLRSVPAPGSRRRFLRPAGGAVATGLLWPALDWPAAQARAAAAGIVPGTAVDAAGRPASSALGLDPFVGEIVLLPFTFAPQGFAECDGQLLQITQNTALFSLLGTTYGGNGQTTFALPDLRGRAPVHFGQGPGLTARFIGESGGSSTVTLIASQVPPHTHAGANVGVGRRRLGPGADVRPSAVSDELAYGTVPGAPMRAGDAAGAGAPHNNLPPYLVLRFCIALQGIFPARN